MAVACSRTVAAAHLRPVCVREWPATRRRRGLQAALDGRGADRRRRHRSVSVADGLVHRVCSLCVCVRVYPLSSLLLSSRSCDGASSACSNDGQQSAAANPLCCMLCAALSLPLHSHHPLSQSRNQHSHTYTHTTAHTCTPAHIHRPPSTAHAMSVDPQHAAAAAAAASSSSAAASSSSGAPIAMMDDEEGEVRERHR